MLVNIDKELIKYTSFNSSIPIDGTTLHEILINLFNKFPQLYAFLVVNNGAEADKTTFLFNGRYLEDNTCLWENVSDEDILCIGRGVPEGAGGVGKLIVGAVLIIAGAVMTAMDMPIGPYIIGMGVSTALGGVAELLTPTPNLPTDGKSSSSTYTFSGIHNTTVSGTPIPIIYGRHRTGGHVLNAYVDTESGLSLSNTRVDVASTFLYEQLGISEGEIEAIEASSVELSGRYAADFDDVSAYWRSGTTAPVEGSNGVLFSTASSTVESVRNETLIMWAQISSVTYTYPIDTSEINPRMGSYVVNDYLAELTVARVESASAINFSLDTINSEIIGVTATPYDNYTGIQIGDPLYIEYNTGFSNIYLKFHDVFTGTVDVKFTASATVYDTSGGEDLGATPQNSDPFWQQGLSLIYFTLYNTSLGIIDTGAAMAGFNKINNVTSYNIFVPNSPTGTPYTIEMDNMGAIVSTATAVDTAAVTIEAPQLYSKSGNAGVYVPLLFYYRKTFSDHTDIASNWTEFTPEDPTINWNVLFSTNATKSTTSLTVTMNFPSPDFYDIKVLRSPASVENDADVTTANSVYLTSLNEILYDDLAYPCTALLGLRIKATNQLSGNLPTITSIVRGVKVAVPTGYVSRFDSRRSCGIRYQSIQWDGTMSSDHTSTVTTGSVVAGSNVITVSDASNISLGNYLKIGTLPPTYTVIGVAGTSITLDQNIGIAQSNVTVTTVKTVWTDNPVWCLYDLLTNTRYGCGQEFNILPNRKGLMLANFYAMAQYCDEYILKDGSVVGIRAASTAVSVGDYVTINNDGFLYQCTTAGTTGSGALTGVTIVNGSPTSTTISDGSAVWTYRGLDSSTPRFSLNLVMDQQKSVREWVNIICATMRATLFNCEGIVILDIDRPKPITQLFNMSNVSNFSQSCSSFKAIPNVYLVQFPNKDKNYVTDSFTLETYEYQQDSTQAQILQNVDFIGVTNVNDARDLTAYMLAKLTSALTVVSFKTGTDLLQSTVTDVIGVQHDVPMWGSGGKITGISGNVLTLSSDFNYSPTNAGDGSLYGDISLSVSQGGLPPATLAIVPPLQAGTFSSVTIVPSGTYTPQIGDVYILNFTTNTVKPFIITSLQRDTSEFITVTAIEYNESIYNVKGDGLGTIIHTNYSTLQLPVKGSVKNFSATQVSVPSVASGSTVGISVEYDIPPNVNWKGLQVAYCKDGGIYRYTNLDATGKLVITDGVESGTWSVVGISWFKDGTAQTLAECLADSTNKPYATIAVLGDVQADYFMSTSVTGLEVVGSADGQFVGRDCRISWRPVVVADNVVSNVAGDVVQPNDKNLLDHYNVCVLNMDGTIRRTDKVFKEEYVYTMEMNHLDSTPTRYFKVSVQAIDINGRSNVPAYLNCSNPEPAAIS